MAFGQHAGPPATARQVQELLELLNEAGHADFRDARGPMGFTQRQAGGKFTRDEADAFIAELRQAADGSERDGSPGDDERHAPASRATKLPAQNTKRGTSAGTPRERETSRTRAPGARPKETALSHVSDSDLAAELQRRGWIVVEP